MAKKNQRAKDVDNVVINVDTLFDITTKELLVVCMGIALGYVLAKQNSVRTGKNYIKTSKNARITKKNGKHYK